MEQKFIDINNPFNFYQLLRDIITNAQLPYTLKQYEIFVQGLNNFDKFIESLKPKE